MIELAFFELVVVGGSLGGDRRVLFAQKNGDLATREGGFVGD